MKNHDLQHAVIEAVRRQAPPGQNLAEVLAPIFGLTINAAYKRISGTTPLTLDDLVQLSRHFQLPLQKIFYPATPTFTAEFSGLAARSSVLEYLHLLDQDLSVLRHDPDAEVWHVTIGLPDFYVYYFEDLTRFQFFTWERMVWNNRDWMHRKFSLNMPEAEAFLPLTKRLAHHFAHLPVTEIWNEYVLDNFFQQLQYVVECRLFERKEDIEQLCNTSASLVVHLKEMAQHGRRFPPGGVPAESAGNWRLFYNEMMKNNIFFLVKTSKGAVVYVVLDNPNFIKITDPGIVEHIRMTFDSLIDRALQINGAIERNQTVFFEKLETRRQDFAAKILASL